MLPTKGYFQDIDCPCYDTSCGRPYCHFRHKKKHQETSTSFSEDSSDVPTYKPTPKNQLANNRAHIPISYVPDLAFRPERTIRSVQKLTHKKPVYKPTPLSVLSYVNKEESVALAKVSTDDRKAGSTSDLIFPDAAKTVPNYCPAFKNDSCASTYTPSHKNEGSQENAEGAYTPAGTITNLIYEPTSKIHHVLGKTDTDCVPSIDSNKVYNPTDESGKIDSSKVYNPTDESEKINSNEVYNPTDKSEIINSNKVYNPTDKSENINSNKVYNPADECEKTYIASSIDFEDLSNEFDMIDEIINISNQHEINDGDKPQRNVEPEIYSAHLKSLSITTKKNDINLPPEEHNNKHLQKHDVQRSDSSKSISEKKHEKKKKPDIVSKIKHSKDILKPTHKEKLSRKAEESNKGCPKLEDHQQKSRHRNTDSSNSTSHKVKHKNQDRTREKKHELKDLEKETKKNHHSVSHRKHINKKTPTDNKSKKKERSREIHKVKHDPYCAEIDTSVNSSKYDLEIDSENEETMEECYRIFKEYKPPKTDDQIFEKEVALEKPSLELTFGKKRTAHINAEKITKKSNLPSSVKSLPNAGQIMANRYKTIKVAQANDEQRNIFEEVKSMTLKRSAPDNLAVVIKNYKVQKKTKDSQVHKTTNSLVDDIITGTNKTNSAVVKFNQRKIAPVTNVYSMQQAKQRIEEMKQKACDSNVKTPAQNVKGTKRIAHVSDFSLIDIPDVLQADKSKLPVNVRTRFLTMMADECGKLYLTKGDAYTRALNEEFACYEKCKVLSTYKNSAMLAVSRIRKEHQERVKLGLEPLYSLEESNKDKCSEFTGKKFHENVSKFLLTEEELDIHGYPREGKMPGKATIKNHKEVIAMSLEEHQRQCSRCSKIYVVDEDGFAFYEEECLYHPLKKRTLRGEQTYLCCKSNNDDTGCSTSHTHVSDCRDNSELEGYQATMKPENDSDDRTVAVYALDCEMCYTTKGLELTRVTIVDSECKTVYDTLVKPLNPIIDYNTRFSGITKEQMDRTSTNILQVQANILHLCNSETILVGHSLESDMKALKIIHLNIIDTAILFPHRLGLPHKRALRALASEYLKKIIQNDISGHDSAEDAITCMELVKWKLKENMKVRGSNI